MGGKVNPRNISEGINVKQPKTEDERATAATTCSAKLELSMPCVMDGMDNKVEWAYAGRPDRLYIVGKDGKIAYKSRPGPRGFDVAEMAEKLKQLLTPDP